MGRCAPAREDIHNARRIFSQEGVEGLRRALSQGVPLPVVMAALAGGGLLAGAGE